VQQHYCESHFECQPRLWKAIWCQGLWVFRRIASIQIFSLVPLHFLSLTDNSIINCKGVGNPEYLARTLVVAIHCFIASVEIVLSVKYLGSPG